MLRKRQQKAAEESNDFINLLKQLNSLLKENPSIKSSVSSQIHSILNLAAIRVEKDKRNVKLEARDVYQAMGELMLVEKFELSSDERKLLEEIRTTSISGSYYEYS